MNPLKVNFNIPIQVTKELLLQRNSEETYMEHYLGIKPGKGLFRSPLRKDKTPTCGFTRDKAGRLVFKDFSGAFYGDFINVVMVKYSVSYHRALEIIANDFGILSIPGLTKNKSCVKEYSNTKFEASEGSEIKVKVKDFTEEELHWWGNFGINLPTLKKFYCFSCELVYLNGDIYSYSSRKKFNFGYFYPVSNKDKQYWRIYYPQNRTRKWISNWSKTMIQGWHLLPKSGELLVITKSMKDCMSLYECNIPAIAPNSETLFLTDAQYDNIAIKFKRIILLWDNDLPGVSNANKIRKKFPNLIVVFIRRNISKDFSDLCKTKGVLKMLEAGEELLSITKNTNNSELSYFYKF